MYFLAVAESVLACVFNRHSIYIFNYYISRHTFNQLSNLNDNYQAGKKC